MYDLKNSSMSYKFLTSSPEQTAGVLLPQIFGAIWQGLCPCSVNVCKTVIREWINDISPRLSPDIPYIQDHHMIGRCVLYLHKIRILSNNNNIFQIFSKI